MSAIAWRWHLFLLQPEPIFKARHLNIVFSSGVQPHDSLPYEDVTLGAYTDIEPEMTLLLGTTEGGDDLGRQRIRKPATNLNVYPGWSSQNTGDGELKPVSNAYITVLKDIRPWAKIPRINNSGTMYMDYDRDFATYGALAPVIVLGLGTAVHALPDPVTGLATFVMNASSSYAIAPGATVAAYAYTLPDGASVVSGATNTHSVTFTLPEGAHLMKLVVTDSAGTSRTRWLWCIAVDEYSAGIVPFAIQQHRRSPDGQRLMVQPLESVPRSTYPDGTLGLVWRQKYVDGVRQSLSFGNSTLFVGWHHSEQHQGQARREGFISETAFEMLDIAGKYRTLPGFPYTVERDGAPNKWSQMAQANIDRFHVRLLGEFSNALALTDFRWSGLGSSYPFPALEAAGASLYEQVDGRAQAIAHRLTTNRLGALAVKADQQLIDPPDADPVQTPVTRTVGTAADIDSAKWSSYRLTRTRPPRLHWNWGEAIQAQAVDADAVGQITALFAVAPGSAPGQGVSAQTSGRQLVVDQDELDAREGHRYRARQNAEFGMVSVDLATNDDLDIEPADMEWIGVTIPDENVTEREIPMDTRALVHEMSIRYDHALGTQDIALQLELEVIGERAQGYTPPKQADNKLPNKKPPSFYQPPPLFGAPTATDLLLLNSNIKNFALFCNNGIALGDITAAYPLWTWIPIATPGIGSGIVAWQLDAESPAGQVNGWITTNAAANAIYYLENVELGASMTATAQKSLLLDVATGGLSGRLKSRSLRFNFAQGNFLGMVMSYYHNHGTYPGVWLCAWDGAAWGTETQLSALSGAENTVPGLHVSTHDPGTALTSAYIAGPTGRLHSIADVGGANTPTALSASTEDWLATNIHVPYHDNADESLYYYSGLVEASGNGGGFIKRRNADGTTTTITPQIGGVNQRTAARNNSMASCPIDKNRMVFCTASRANGAETVYAGAFVTRDGGDTMTVIDETGLYSGADVAGDDPDKAWLYGHGGILMTTDGFASTHDKTGDLMDYTPGEIIGIAGLPEAS